MVLLYLTKINVIQKNDVVIFCVINLDTFLKTQISLNK